MSFTMEKLKEIGNFQVESLFRVLCHRFLRKEGMRVKVGPLELKPMKYQSLN